jgi:F0F1-type ATP synthase membrane subunit b/b'
MATMCKTCSIQTNKAAWANYPDMLDLCKMCKSFQASIEHTIEEADKVRKKAAAISKKIEDNLVN